MEQKPDWNVRNAKQIGRQLENLRKATKGKTGRPLTVQALADRCSEIGHPMDRSVIAKLEKGLRQTVTVAELVVLARALRVPPALLLYPIGESEEVEFLPGQTARPWAAYSWFIGEDRVPIDNLVPGGTDEDGINEWYDDPEADWPDAAAPVLLWRRHAMQVQEWRSAFLVGRDTRLPADQYADQYAELVRHRGMIEHNLRAIRADMRRLGLTPPTLRKEMEHIDPPRTGRPQ